MSSALLIFSLLMLHEFNEPSPHINLNGELRHKFGFVTNIPVGFFIRCLRIIKMFEVVTKMSHCIETNGIGYK